MLCVSQYSSERSQYVRALISQGKTKKQHWLNALRLKDEDIGSHDRVCSRHFPESSGVSGGGGGGGGGDAQDARAPKAKECN